MLMLVLFIRAVLLYVFILFIIRLTGKRQVSDLQPFDLLITLTIADLASCAIAETDIPLLYSIVPILALFLVQQAVVKLCLKSSRARRAFCGSPLILVRDGVLQEQTMRYANYTVTDLVDQLRSKDIFDIGDVCYAVLETNGGVSILQKGENVPTALSHMLVLDGKVCQDAVSSLSISTDELERSLEGNKLSDVLYMQLSADGKLRTQLKKKKGAKQFVSRLERSKS